MRKKKCLTSIPFKVLNNEIPGDEIVLDFECKADKTTYSICDLMGNELLSGKLHHNRRHTIPIHKLGAGVYMICIIDGDQLIQKRFRKLALGA